MKVVIWYAVTPETACDWSKCYANHLVTSLIDSSNQKWANQNGESPFMECDWLKCDVCKRDMIDRCE